ncbi:Scr1 family TA system antitoxin-like transcriptional regulator [Streptomyces beigongshangae]|uniref:Scr1 family TA system antitoxin-like transcriptional regulator n=1 Tax=Streptomyces beigongshangae TaxID=2841597 RepID=UPI0027E0DB1B|nr:Scr1 family TA system antitoxin-like transcriptional regulator [Streptomyces sp. REN17]
MVAEDADTGEATADTSGQAVVVAFGRTPKTLRVRAGLEREEFGRRIGYAASTVASYDEDNAGVDGAFTVITRRDGTRFVYTEVQGTSALQTEPEQTTLAAARYGIMRSQALPSRESLDFVERLLRSL